MTFGTTQGISISGCSTTNPEILPPPRLSPQHIWYVLPTHPRIMPSITVWSHSNAGSISLTATLSFIDHLTLLLLGLARHVTESVNLTGMSSQNISPSIATHPHALTSHPTPFMLIKTSMLPMLTHRAHSFFWRLQQKAPMAVPLSTKGCGQSDSFSTHKPPFFLNNLIGSQKGPWCCEPR